jgi:hypothetical protein
MNKKGSYSVFIISSVFLAISLVLVITFRIIFPGDPAPLPLFSISWRLTRGFIDFILLFPALAFSALVLPFGLQESPGDQFSRFSSRFLEIIKGHIILAIILTVVYGIFALLVFPLLVNAQDSMQYEGELYRNSRENAREAANENDWNSAARYFSVCEQIWPNNPELASENLRERITIGLTEQEMEDAAETRDESIRDPWLTLGIPLESVPVNAEEALSMAEKAFSAEQFYDAHWLATVAARLTREGSAERKNIELFAADAWNKIESMEPSSAEMRTYALFHQKLDGYNAMTSGDWIRAYYIFQDLLAKTPDDRELQDFFAMTKTGIEKTAFFQDEINTDSGELQNEAIFSLPVTGQFSSSIEIGRMILRMNTLSTFPDFSYATGIEVIALDSNGNLAYRMEAPYGKVIPLDINDEEKSGDEHGIHQSVLLMNVLDRNDETIRWQPHWSISETNDISESSQMILNVSYDDFLLLSDAKKGLRTLSVKNLFLGIDRLGAYGYIPEIFEAEILNRFIEPMSFLPAAIFIIIIGWRFRAIKRPRYIMFPMIAVLPVVFNGVTAFYRNIAHTFGTSLILSMNFTGALLVFFAVNFVIFILVLIILAGQHG